MSRLASSNGRARRARLILAMILAGLTSLAGFAASPPASAAGEIVFDGVAGASAPPAVLGGYTMAPFGPDGAAQYSLVDAVPSPEGSSLGFGGNLKVLGAGESTGGWTPAYGGHVYSQMAPYGPMTLTLPPGTKAFYFYAKPDPCTGWWDYAISATTPDGTTSGLVQCGTNGQAARFFGFYTNGNGTIESITIQTDYSAVSSVIGQFGIGFDSGDEAPRITSLTADHGLEGTPIALNATVADDGGSPLTYAWSYEARPDVPAGATCTMGNNANPEDATIACTDDGTYAVTLAASNVAGTSTKSIDVTVSNAAPTIISASFTGSLVSCQSEVELSVEYADQGVNDTHNATIAWGDGSLTELAPSTHVIRAPHRYNAGQHEATVTIVDDDGGIVTASAAVTVDYDTGQGILQPVNRTGPTSLFKYGRTIPIKIQIRNCDGSPANNLHPTIAVRLVSDTTPEGTEELGIASSSNADNGTTMRLSADGTYVYNLDTKSLSDPTAQYTLIIKVQPGQTSTASIGLK